MTRLIFLHLFHIYSIISLIDDFLFALYKFELSQGLVILPVTNIYGIKCNNNLRHICHVVVVASLSKHEYGCITLHYGIVSNNDDVIKWKHFPRYWPFVPGIHRSPVISPHKGQWRGGLMFSFICVWTNSRVNNREAGDLRLYRAHYDVILMKNCRNTCICPIPSLSHHSGDVTISAFTLVPISLESYFATPQPFHSLFW